MKGRIFVRVTFACGCGLLILLAGCAGSGAGGSGTGGDIADPGSDLVNTLWVGEDEGDDDPPGDVVMTFRENGKGVWVTYEDWASTERSITNGACFTVEFLSDTEMDVTVYAEFNGESWEPAGEGSQPGVMPYSVVDGVMTVGEAAAPEFVVTMIDDGLSDPLRGTSWKYFDIEFAGRAHALEFRSDGSMEYLSFEESNVYAGRGTYFLYGLDNDDPSDDTVVRVATEQRESILSDWTDTSNEPAVYASSFSFGDDGTLALLPENIAMSATEGDGSLQGNAWLGHEVWIDSGPQIEALGLAAAAAPDDVLILAHTNGSYGFSVFDEWLPDADPQTSRLSGNCGMADFSSEISADFEVYSAWDSGGDSPDWSAAPDTGQSWIAHLGDLFIEQIDGDGTGYAVQYMDIGELNPLSGTHWVGTFSGDTDTDGGDSAPATLDADLLFASDGTFEGVFTDDGVIAMGIRGRYFVVAPGEMAWWIDEEYNTESESWGGVEPNSWGIEFQIEGNELSAADYSGDNVVEATLAP